MIRQSSWIRSTWSANWKWCRQHMNIIRKSRVCRTGMIDTLGAKNHSEPVAKETVAKLSESQEEMILKYDSRQSQMVNRYIKGEERSFTIIAYPVPGDRRAVWRDFWWDYPYKHTRCKSIWKSTADTDWCGWSGENTCIFSERMGIVQIWMCSYIRWMTRQKKQSENCVADVNIPVGEVFTSPVLEGTNGVLRQQSVSEWTAVSWSEIIFSNGMVSEYNCANFDRDLENKAYIHDNVLYKHPTLPLGEFAIGTNTTAYI